MPEVQLPTPSPRKRLTQKQKIVIQMCQRPEQTWWLPNDFMRGSNGDLFVGCEASARLSELQSENPSMFESRRKGKYIERRICFETGQDWINNISKDLQDIVNKYYE